MTDAVAPTAGGLLKAAREKQGLHVAALAASIKVTPRKLEALEGDRYGELPDMTFVRALAKAVCRALKIDAEPVLALLPHQADIGPKLAQVSTGLSQPFRERPSRSDPPDWAVLQRPVLWGAGLVMVAALVVFLLPERSIDGWLRGGSAASGVAADIADASTAGASAVVTEVVDAASAAIETVHSTPPMAEAPAVAAVPTPALTPAVVPASAPAAAAAVVAAVVPAAPASAAVPSAQAASGALVLRAKAESWVEVRDANARVVFSRTLQPGETVGVDGAMPMRATIGNAAGTQVTFRGQPVDLSTTRDNVARLELK